MHGLKKGGMRRAAEAGLSAHQLGSLSGHKTIAMLQLYCDAADREKLAEDATAQLLRSRSALEVTQTPADQLHKRQPRPLIGRTKKPRTA
jgi:hypothetical protein